MNATTLLPLTAHEARLCAALTALGVRHKPRHAFGMAVVAAWIPSAALAVDIDYYRHYVWPRRLARDETLLARHGTLAVYVQACDLADDAQAVEAVRAALAPFMIELRENAT